MFTKENEVQDYRKKNKIPEGDLKEIAVRLNSLSRLENGSQEPSMGYLYLLGRMGVSLDHIFFGKEENKTLNSNNDLFNEKQGMLGVDFSRFLFAEGDSTENDKLSYIREILNRIKKDQSFMDQIKQEVDLKGGEKEETKEILLKNLNQAIQKAMREQEEMRKTLVERYLADPEFKQDMRKMVLHLLNRES